MTSTATVVLLALASVAVVSGWSTPSSATTTELVVNQSVETSLAPWGSAYNSASLVQRVAGGYDGSYAVRASNRSSSTRDVGFRDSPRNVTNTSAGQSYQLSVWVRSEVPGRTISLRVKEFSPSNAAVGVAITSHQATDTQWHQIQLTYTARASGSSLSFIVFGSAVTPGQGFSADLFSASTTTAPSPTESPSEPSPTESPSEPSPTESPTEPSPTETPTEPSPTQPPTSGTPGPGTRPNIVVINLDDMRADSLDHMPLTRLWLADGGTSFVNGYVSTPSCCPSRATLLSGRYVHNNGQVGQLTLGFDQTLTIQRYLQQAGYLTGHSGKYLHWLALSERAPYFDRWMYFKGGYIDRYMNVDGVVRKSSGYSTVLTFDHAIGFLNDFESRDDTQPWYVSIAPVAPHSPSVAEAKYAEASVPPHAPDPSYLESDRSDKPPWVRNKSTSESESLSTRTAMTRTLYTVDDQVDRLMRHLESTGEIDDTMVVFTSDNGYLWGEHHLTSKFVPYRKSVEVPFLIRWPGHAAAGAVDTRFVTHVDIAPTALAAAGVTETVVPMDGRDIFSGYSRPQAFTEYFLDSRNGSGRPTWASLRSPTYQYTEYYDADGAVTFREYYDMVADPYQLVNLLGDGTSTNDPDYTAISAELQQQRQCAGSTCK